MTDGRQGQHPAGRRPAGQAAELRGHPRGARREPDQGRVRPGSARAPAQERDRRRPDRRLHAGARRLPAGGDDPRASALPEDRDHLHLGDPSDRHRPPARLRDGRGRLCSGAGRPGGAARQGAGSSPSSIARPGSSSSSTHELERRVAERTAELEASTARLLQSEQRRSLALAAGQMGSWDWDPVNGDCRLGRRPVSDFRRRSRKLRRHRRQHARA